MISRELLMRILNGAFFYGGWLVCMWAAAHQKVWLAVLSTAAIVLIHILVSKQRAKDLALLLIVCVLGTLLDTVYLNVGLLTYQCLNEVVCWMAPVWITSIYALLAINLDHSLGWLNGKFILSALFGAGGAVATYFAGERAGLVTFVSDAAPFIIMIVWFFFLPGLYLLSNKLGKLVG